MFSCDRPHIWNMFCKIQFVINVHTEYFHSSRGRYCCIFNIYHQTINITTMGWNHYWLGWSRWGILASGVCTLRPAHQDLHTEVPRTPTPSCAECMKYYKTLFKETQPMYFWMPAFYWQVTMLWWQFIWTHTHTNDIWRMLKNQINMIIWIWCIMNVLAELRIENVSQAGLPKYNI